MFTDYIPRLLLEGDRNLQFKFGVVIVLISLILFRVLNIKFGLALIVIFYYFSNIYLQKQYTDVSDFNRSTKYKLEKIQNNYTNYIKKKLEMSRYFSKEDYKRNLELAKLNYLFIDTNFIHFLDNIDYFRTYNEKIYFSVVKGINNILKLRWDSEQIYNNNKGQPVKEFEKRQLYYNFEETERLSDVVNENFHSFIFTLPKSNLSYDHHAILSERLAKLLLYSVNIQRFYYNECTFGSTSTSGITVSTKFLPNKNVFTKGVHS
jgi:hypothetical protein